MYCWFMLDGKWIRKKDGVFLIFLVEIINDILIVKNIGILF